MDVVEICMLLAAGGGDWNCDNVRNMGRVVQRDRGY
jgi:hypothetical protein